jgi:hypothetical protein
MDIPKTGYDDTKYSGGLLGRGQIPSSRSLFTSLFYDQNLGHTAVKIAEQTAKLNAATD